MALFSPRVSSDGLIAYGILQNTFLYSPAIFIKVDLLSMTYLLNFDLTPWTNTANQGEYVMTMNSLQNTVYLCQMFPGNPRYIFKMTLTSNNATMEIFYNSTFFGSVRELQLNASDTRLFVSTVGAPGDVGVYVISTTTRTLVGSTVYNFPIADITAYDGALILSSQLALFTTKKGLHFAYPAIVFSLNIGNLIGTVYGREGATLTLDSLLHRVDMFQFTPDNSRILVVGYNDSNYDINILSLNANTLAVGSRIVYKLPYSIWSWPIFLGGKINSTASTLHLFYFFRSKYWSTIILNCPQAQLQR